MYWPIRQRRLRETNYSECWSIADKIKHLAHRYFRRFPGTFSDWNAFCEIAANQLSGNPRATSRATHLSEYYAVSCSDGRWIRKKVSSRVLRFDPNGLISNYPWAGEIERRYNRMLYFKASKCAQCHVSDETFTKNRQYGLNFIYSKGRRSDTDVYVSRLNHKNYCTKCHRKNLRFIAQYKESLDIAKDVRQLKDLIKNGNNKQHQSNTRESPNPRRRRQSVG